MILIWRLRRLKQRWHDEVFLRVFLAANRKGLARSQGQGRALDLLCMDQDTLQYLTYFLSKSISLTGNLLNSL